MIIRMGRFAYLAMTFDLKSAPNTKIVVDKSMSDGVVDFVEEGTGRTILHGVVTVHNGFQQTWPAPSKSIFEVPPRNPYLAGVTTDDEQGKGLQVPEVR